MRSTFAIAFTMDELTDLSDHLHAGMVVIGAGHDFFNKLDEARAVLKGGRKLTAQLSFTRRQLGILGRYIASGLTLDESRSPVCSKIADAMTRAGLMPEPALRRT